MFLSFVAAPLLHAADIPLRGFVRDENSAPVAGARVTVRPAFDSISGGPWQAQTDPEGAYSISLPVRGDYLVDVERQGYYQLKDRRVHLEAALELTLNLAPVREVFQSVDVSGQPSPVDIAQTQNQEQLSGTEINDILYQNSHSFSQGLLLMPGVLMDPTGGLHFDGSSGNQVQYQLNGFNISDPLSGGFNTTLAVEGIRSVDFASGRYSPQFGKGTAGVLNIQTDNGTDAFHYTATDFIPGADFKQGQVLGNWYPRVGVSGPIARGRAWFSDTVNFAYTNSLITGLPAGQNTRSGLATSNLFHTQVNLSPTNILYTDFLITIDNENRLGLGPLDPISTTQTVDTREYFGSIKDQVYLSPRSLIEFGYAHNEFTGSQVPQGDSLYVFSPAGRMGNYFVTGHQDRSRDQGLVHWYAPKFNLAGSHQIEAGGDGDSLYYTANFQRTGYELIGFSNQLLSQTTFTGSGMVLVHDTEMAAWVLDSWRIARRLQIDLGARGDWDQLVAAGAVSPRIAFTWSPFRDHRTRLAGGYSITHDAVPLDPFGRLYDQTALTTEYNAAGLPAGPPVPTTFVPGSGLKLPRASNWTLAADHEFSAHLSAGIKYLRRRGTEGFDFVNLLAPDAPPSLLPLPNGSAPGIYQLANLRRDNYDSVQFTVHKTFSGQYEWMASYTRSSARSNAVLNNYTAEPLAIVPAAVPVPWDAPNRFVGWAYLPLPWKNWAVSLLADARSGFPFSVQQQTGIITGPVDSYRFPFNFDLDFAIERMLTFHHYRFALRGGVVNLTGSRNPTAVGNTIGANNYLQFLGDEGRHFVVRVRFFGRAETK
ncbi:MAG TPA: carboxypeptidase regulatory-like domain-containing protein [Bryobacteraceae bacterium]|nr:carboxypeptidase regulatory-like domain-containing protein [Bryobacteraceae bacterium]